MVWKTKNPNYVSMGMPKNSPYYDFFNFQLIKLQEAGVLEVYSSLIWEHSIDKCWLVNLRWFEIVGRDQIWNVKMSMTTPWERRSWLGSFSSCSLEFRHQVRNNTQQNLQSLFIDILWQPWENFRCFVPVWNTQSFWKNFFRLGEENWKLVGKGSAQTSVA